MVTNSVIDDTYSVSPVECGSTQSITAESSVSNFEVSTFANIKESFYHENLTRCHNCSVAWDEMKSQTDHLL